MSKRFQNPKILNYPTRQSVVLRNSDIISGKSHIVYDLPYTFYKIQEGGIRAKMKGSWTTELIPMPRIQNVKPRLPLAGPIIWRPPD